MKLTLSLLIVATFVYAAYAACGGADDCFTCLRRTPHNDDLCGWCADDLTCYSGTSAGPGGFDSNCTDSWFFDTCSGEDCSVFDGSCGACVDNPLCGYCHGSGDCLEVQDEDAECSTDDFSTYDCSVSGEKCDAGEVLNGSDCVDCPPFGNQDSQSSNACNFVGHCIPSGDSARCDCKNGFSGSACQLLNVGQGDLGLLDSTTATNGATVTLSNPTVTNNAVTQASVTNNAGADIECSLLSIGVDSDGDVNDQGGYASVSLASGDGVGDSITGNTGFDLSCVDGNNEDVDIDDLSVSVTVDASTFGLTCDEIDIGKYDTDNNEWVSVREECGAPTGSTICVFDICHFSQYAVVQGATSGSPSASPVSFSSPSSFSPSSSSSSSSSSGASAVQPALLLAALALFGALFTF